MNLSTVAFSQCHPPVFPIVDFACELKFYSRIKKTINLVHCLQLMLHLWQILRCLLIWLLAFFYRMKKKPWQSGALIMISQGISNRRRILKNGLMLRCVMFEFNYSYSIGGEWAFFSLDIFKYERLTQHGPLHAVLHSNHKLAEKKNFLIFWWIENYTVKKIILKGALNNFNQKYHFQLPPTAHLTFPII